MLGRTLRWAFSTRGRGLWSSAWRVLVFWLPLTAFGFPLIFGRFDDLESFIRSSAISFVIGAVSGGVVFLFMGAAEHLTSWWHTRHHRTPPDKSNLWWAFVAATALPPGVLLGFTIANIWFDIGPVSYRSVAYGVGIGIACLTAAILFEVMGDLKDAQLNAKFHAQELENARLQGEVSALTAQMNPHLLFNSLNTIASLVQSSPDTAEETTVALADLYRGVLKASKKDFHTLREELELCRGYLGIEQARFGNRIAFSVHADGVDLEATVPPLIVQPLVENAIKHGLSSKAEGGTVTIDVSDAGAHMLVSIHDDGVGFESDIAKNPDSTALDNIQQRLSLLYQKDAALTIAPASPGTIARLQIPKEVG